MNSYDAVASLELKDLQIKAMMPALRLGQFSASLHAIFAQSAILFV
jgi:hypothetical protein